MGRARVFYLPIYWLLPAFVAFRGVRGGDSSLRKGLIGQWTYYPFFSGFLTFLSKDDVPHILYDLYPIHRIIPFFTVLVLAYNLQNFYFNFYFFNREMDNYVCLIIFPDGLPGQSKIDYG